MTGDNVHHLPVNRGRPAWGWAEPAPAPEPLGEVNGYTPQQVYERIAELLAPTLDPSATKAARAEGYRQTWSLALLGFASVEGRAAAVRACDKAIKALSSPEPGGHAA